MFFSFGASCPSHDSRVKAREDTFSICWHLSVVSEMMRGGYPSCISPAVNSPSKRGLGPNKYPRGIRCIWGWLWRGHHPKDTIIFPYYARTGDEGIGVGILKLSRLWSLWMTSVVSVQAISFPWVSRVWFWGVKRFTDVWTLWPGCRVQEEVSHISLVVTSTNWLRKSFR